MCIRKLTKFPEKKVSLKKLNSSDFSNVVSFQVVDKSLDIKKPSLIQGENFCQDQGGTGLESSAVPSG